MAKTIPTSSLPPIGLLPAKIMCDRCRDVLTSDDVASRFSMLLASAFRGLDWRKRELRVKLAVFSCCDDNEQVMLCDRCFDDVIALEARTRAELRAWLQRFTEAQRNSLLVDGEL